MLPAIGVAVAVQQRITSCPPPAADQMRQTLAREAESDFKPQRFAIGIDYTVGISAKQQPLRLVHLNVDSGFLVDRETQVHFANDWYLKDFNGKTTGQGGPVVVALIKGAAAIYGMAVPPAGLAMAVAAATAAAKGDSGVVGARDGPPHRRPKPRTIEVHRSFLVCRPAVVNALAAIKSKTADLETLQKRVIAGDKDDLTRQLLADRKAEVAKLQSDLTQTSRSLKKGPLLPGIAPDSTYTDVAVGLGALDPNLWFESEEVSRIVLATYHDFGEAHKILAELLDEQKPIAGRYGYQVTIKIDDHFAPVVGCPSGDIAIARQCRLAMRDTAPIKTRDLIYQRPIPATVDVAPTQPPCSTGTACSKVDFGEGFGFRKRQTAAAIMTIFVSNERKHLCWPHRRCRIRRNR